jgi:hypothetical protein
MDLTLSALVKSALTEADQQLKLASASDVAPEGSIKLATEGMEYEEKDEDKKKEEEKKKAKKEGEEEGGEEKKSSVGLADHSLKLAEAIDHIGNLWTKIAVGEGPGTLPIAAGQHNVGDTTKDTSTSAATVPAQQASSGGGPAEASQGYPAGIDTNKKDFKDPEWKGNPEANRGAARTSGVHPGEGTKAASLNKQRAMLARFGGKLAQDPSSPQPTGLGTTGNPGKLDMVPAASTAIGENQALIDMTKKKALTSFVKEDAAKVLREPAFSKATDKGISDNLAQDGGNKLSSVQAGAGRALLSKVAAAAKDPHASPQMRVKVARFQKALERIHQRRQLG